MDKEADEEHAAREKENVSDESGASPKEEKTESEEALSRKAIESVRRGVGSVFSVIAGSKEGVAESRAEQQVRKEHTSREGVSLKELAFPKKYTPFRGEKGGTTESSAPPENQPPSTPRTDGGKTSPPEETKPHAPRPSPADLGVSPANDKERQVVDEAAHRTSLPYTKERIVGKDGQESALSAKDILLKMTSLFSGKPEKKKGDTPVEEEEEVKPPAEEKREVGGEESGEKEEAAEAAPNVEEERALPEKQTETWLRPLRTYKDDVAQAIQKKKTSFVSMVAAEAKKKSASLGGRKEETQAEPVALRAKLIVVGAGVALIVLGVASVSFFYFLREERGTVAPAERTQSLVFTETESVFAFSGRRGSTLVTALASHTDRASLTLNTMMHVILVDDTLLGERQVNTAGFFDAIGASLSKSAVRSLASDFTFGIHSFDRNQPFLMFKTSLFELAFRGMLDWESAMNRELAPWFGPLVTRSLPPPSVEETASSVSPVAGARFVDRVIKNKDTRVLFNEDGRIMLLYSFIDKDTLVITTNTATFEELVTRFSTRRVQ